MTPTKKDTPTLAGGACHPTAEPARVTPVFDSTPSLAATQSRILRQPSEAWWTLYGTLKPWEAGDMVKILRELYRPEPWENKADLSDEIAAIDRLQSELGTRAYISGGEVMEINSSEPSDEEYPF
jgi:hypothetical protein